MTPVSETPSEIDRLTNRRVWRLAGQLMIVALPAIVGRHVLTRVTGIGAEVAASHPYFSATHFALLYLAVPLITLSASSLFLAPGLLLALGLNRARSVDEWMVWGLLCSLPLVSIPVAILQMLRGVPPREWTFALLVLATTLLVAWWSARRTRISHLPIPWRVPGAGVVIVLMALIPLLLAVALTPKIYWESFNGDGAHAFEASRLLLHHALPFWDPSAGYVSVFPGVTSMLYAWPMSWYVRLFGELDASARLPFFLYLPALAGAVSALVTVGRSVVLARMDRALIWLVIAIFAVTIAYSASYSPYSADLALPATQDTLLVVCVLASMLAFTQGDIPMLVLSAVGAFTSLPNGLVLLGFWVIAVWLIVRPRPRREIRALIATLVACELGAILMPIALKALGAFPPGGEYGGVGVLRYFAFLQFTDWSRVLYVAVPSGLAPMVALVWWRRQDDISRVLTLVTLAYFLFFFVQARISLHHFIPAMLLPVVVYWRMAVADAGRRVWRIGALAGGVGGMLLALPRDWGPHLTGKEIGATIAENVGSYAEAEPSVFRHSAMFTTLFPFDWDPAVPERTYGGSPLVWLRYATHGTVPAGANYALVPSAAPPPAGMHPVASDDAATLYVRSDSIWALQRAVRPPSPVASAALDVPRGILFLNAVPLEQGPTIISMVDVLASLGVDVDGLLARLGVKRRS